MPVRSASASPKLKPVAPALLLAQTWTNDVDLASWWLSEKLDGVRAYWDGQRFLSRQGNLFHAPDWFTAELPPIPLDGELWIARKRFQRTVSIVRRQDTSDLWGELAFVVFDAPAVSDVFERRMEAIRDALAAGGNQRVETVELPGLNHLFQTCQTGAIAEYSQIEETFSPAALQMVSDWILEITRR